MTFKRPIFWWITLPLALLIPLCWLTPGLGAYVISLCEPHTEASATGFVILVWACLFAMTQLTVYEIYKYSFRVLDANTEARIAEIENRLEDRVAAIIERDGSSNTEREGRANDLREGQTDDMREGRRR